MTYGTRTDHYPATSKLLHWLVAACVLITAPVAIAMTRGKPIDKTKNHENKNQHAK